MSIPERNVSEVRFPRLTTLQGGALTAVVHDAYIRNIRYNGTEVLKGIYFTVRDEMWHEVSPVHTESHFAQQRDSFRVDVHLHYDSPSVGLECLVCIQARAGDTLTYQFSAKATKECKTNRLGLCILHGCELAGQELRVYHTNGKATQGKFPAYISANQPFTDISGLRWMPSHTVYAELKVDGDVFEMEDQRNWSDDSFKTYCTPLHLPKPVIRAAGTLASQQVTLKLQALESTVQLESRSAVHPQSQTRENETATVLVPQRIRCQLPYIGVTVPAAVDGVDLDHLISDSRVDHVHKQLDLAAPDWETTLSNDLTLARKSQLKLALEVDGVGHLQNLHQLLELTSKSGVCLPLTLYCGGGSVTSEHAVQMAQHKLDTLPKRVGICGGTRGHYAQLNRSTICEQHVDSVSFGVSPTVHMRDLLSIVETLNAQRQMVMDIARYMRRDVPIHVGPVTLFPRFNADFVISEDNPVIDADDALYHSNFYAAWMLGSIDALSQTGVFAVTYSHHGMTGDQTTHTTPVYRFLSELQSAARPHVLDTQTSDRGIHCLATKFDDVTKVFLANLTDSERLVNVKFEEAPSNTFAVHQLTTQGMVKLDSDVLKSMVSLYLPSCGTALITTN
ncbi:hypothetical protein [Alicyclobacillus mengziensis]|uniref:Uncharacterized protein n=1 Tax=Alicyclobacillus mengziensis TaxID=2931921 RepID=A0A9X7Z7G0_9BACL|nr:hypothetical protein [Alicyclobacillus mengziensis]QSO47315.1 hypothetical protein JZ786_23495 [Alicyclobacillus mengziensis]